MAATPIRAEALPGGRGEVIFGGTFDPPHLGHMAVIEGLRRELKLPLTVIPNGNPPHRSRPTASPLDRLRMLRLSVQELGDSLVSVSDLEVKRPGPSYSADTLATIAARDTSRELFLALGADAASRLSSWERPEVVLESARLVLFDRLGTSDRGEEVIANLGRLGWRVEGARVLRISAPEVEASEVRQRLSQGDRCPDALSPAVARDIAARGLYGWPKGRLEAGMG
jgi:nicotinate-nucleotide adenylyltransferase